MNVFGKYLEQLDISLTEQQYEQFYLYYELLTEKNKVMNLTAITDFDEVIVKHFIDSLSLVKVYELKKAARILDLGTGAGFPGIPLKIAFPELELVLLDSLNKRVRFLGEVIDALGLNKITAIHGRAEELGRKKEYRESFDLCVSRAVANLASLSEYCIPFVKPGGHFISYKSGKIQEEVENSTRAIHKLGGNVKKIETFCLPDTDIERAFVLIEKVKYTPSQYPRGAGKPVKEPIT